MKIIPTKIPDVIIIEPQVFNDSRGFFFESFNQHAFNEAVGEDIQFVQDNYSSSKKGVLRGLHYQLQQPQGKLVRAVRGVIFDVVVDLRESSPTFSQWVGSELSEDNRRQIWVPSGFAHGFLTLSENADCLYKTTDYYAPECERILSWNDKSVGVEWPDVDKHIISLKDLNADILEDLECFP